MDGIPGQPIEHIRVEGGRTKTQGYRRREHFITLKLVAAARVKLNSSDVSS